jgi:hypothetical protein
MSSGSSWKFKLSAERTLESLSNGILDIVILDIVVV